MRRTTGHSTAGGTPQPARNPFPAEQPEHIFVDERGLRTRVIRWLGRGVTAAAGLYVVMLVGGALFGVSLVPRLSLPDLTGPVLAPQAARPEPEPLPAPAATGSAGPEAAPRASASRATARAGTGTTQPAALTLSSAQSPAAVLPAAPAPSPAAPVPAPAPPGPADVPEPGPTPEPTPGQRGHEVAEEHGKGPDKESGNDKGKNAPADPGRTDA
jgi:hypothetical protein